MLNLLTMKLVFVAIVIAITLFRAYLVAETKTVRPTIVDTLSALQHVWVFPLLAFVFLYAL